MSKRKPPADAFGLSLMDVLSNALGGVILLVMIVAVTLKGNDRLRKNKPEEERAGQEYTALDLDRSPVVPARQLKTVVLQIHFTGAPRELSVDEGEHTLGMVGDSRDALASHDWLFTIPDHDRMPPKLVIRTTDKAAHTLGDSVSVIATDEALFLGSRTVPLDPSKRDEFIRLTRSGSSVLVSLQGVSIGD